jgi:hypothetical protein
MQLIAAMLRFVAAVIFALCVSHHMASTNALTEHWSTPSRPLFEYLHDVLPLTLDLLTTTDMCADLLQHSQLLNMLADFCRGMCS